MEHLSDDHEDHPNQHENSHKLCDKTGHLVVNLMESQWKLRQQHDQNMKKVKKVIDRGKRSKALSELKPVENISKNLQSFLVLCKEC